MTGSELVGGRKCAMCRVSQCPSRNRHWIASDTGLPQQLCIYVAELTTSCAAVRCLPSTNVVEWVSWEPNRISTHDRCVWLTTTRLGFGQSILPHRSALFRPNPEGRRHAVARQITWLASWKGNCCRSSFFATYGPDSLRGTPSILSLCTQIFLTGPTQNSYFLRYFYSVFHDKIITFYIHSN